MGRRWVHMAAGWTALMEQTQPLPPSAATRLCGGSMRGRSPYGDALSGCHERLRASLRARALRLPTMVALTELRPKDLTMHQLDGAIPRHVDQSLSAGSS